MNILDFLYPPRCPFCGEYVEKGRILCDACEKTVCRIPADLCPLCWENRKRCQCKKYFFDDICAVYGYDTGARTGIMNIKFHKKVQGLVYLSSQMAAYVKFYFGDQPIDVIVPVPLGEKRRRKRGYNQAELLGQTLASNLKIPIDSRLLKKIYNTPPQSLQQYESRSGNIAGVYEVHHNADLIGRNILLVDDVCTSGATLNECAKMLKFSGADHVFAVVLAKAGKKPSNILVEK